ncbi:ROK family protein, partial [Pectobacterium brasiliense]
EQRLQHLLGQGYPSKLSIDSCSISAICKSANRGDDIAREVIEQAALKLVKALSIAINLFKPQKVEIAGENTEEEKTLLPAIQRCINAQELKEFRHNLQIEISSLN